MRLRLARVTVAELFFVLSSRRRHTRCLSDWSSDVCSSDLPRELVAFPDIRPGGRPGRREHGDENEVTEHVLELLLHAEDAHGTEVPDPGGDDGGEIGRASCRERV